VFCLIKKAMLVNATVGAFVYDIVSFDEDFNFVVVFFSIVVGLV